MSLGTRRPCSGVACVSLTGRCMVRGGLGEVDEFLFEALHRWSDNGIVLLGKHFVSRGQVCFHIGEAERED
jgi:hypothetical protein